MNARAVSVLCKLGTALFLFACTRQPGPHRVERGFYYWRSVFRLSPAELRTIDSLHITAIYTRFFDVAWEPAAGARPVAPIRFESQWPANVSLTPVVFITNETLLHTHDAAVDSLADHIGTLLQSMTAGRQLKEVQIDCDWSTSTRDDYFRLLRRLRSTAVLQGRRLSATIRLHQLKYRSLTGVPPVDRGLLMCYNMGNLHDPLARNSILDPAEMKKYTANLATYPLPLDAALPIFDWYAFYHNGQYKGLFYSEQLPSLLQRPQTFQQDTTVDGISFHRGDYLRYEGSDGKDVLQAARLLSRGLANTDFHGLLYHLDERNLQRYPLAQLNSFYDALR